MRLLQKLFLDEKSLLDLKYSEDRGLYVVARKDLKREDMQYLVMKHARHIKHKIDETFYALDFYEYKKETEESAKDSNKSAKSEPVWDGPFQFFRFGCDKHCTFNVVLQENPENRNRCDYYLQIQKQTCVAGEELTIFHNRIDNTFCELCKPKEKITFSTKMDEIRRKTKRTSEANLLSKNNVVVIQNGFYKIEDKVVKCRYVHEDGHATFFMSGGSNATVKKFVVKDLELQNHYYGAPNRLSSDDELSSITANDHVVRVQDKVYNIECKDGSKYQHGTILKITTREESTDTIFINLSNQALPLPVRENEVSLSVKQDNSPFRY